MNAIIDRSVYEPGGLVWLMTGGRCKPLPKDVAYLVSDYRGRREVTWREVMEERRERQAEDLEWNRRESEPAYAPCYVWVFDNGPIIPYGGWWCYIVTRHESRAVNFRGFNARLAASLMKNVPCGLQPSLMDGEERQFEEWMPLFARQFACRRRGRRREGRLIGWISGGEFLVKKPDPEVWPGLGI